MGQPAGIPIRARRELVDRRAQAGGDGGHVGPVAVAAGHHHLVGAPGAPVGGDHEAVADPLDDFDGGLGLDRGTE